MILKLDAVSTSKQIGLRREADGKDDCRALGLPLSNRSLLRDGPSSNHAGVI